MKRAHVVGALALALAVGGGSLVRADVKTEERSQVKFEGMLGRMFTMFGGHAAKEGLTSTVAVKGDRKMMVNEYTGQIVDLGEEKVYDLDMRGKSYKVTTFAELRRQMEEARKKAEENAARQKSGKAEPGKPAQEVEVDFDLKETGQKRTIIGYDCREVVMTITVREKGKTLEQGGGMVLTADTWLAPRIPAMKEIADFEMRYAKQMAGLAGGAMSAEQMAAVMAMYPMMAEAMKKLRAEDVNMDGTALLTTMTMDAVKSPEQAEQESKSDSGSGASSGIGGLMGGLGRKMAKKNDDAAAGGAAKNRATFMTNTHEVLKVGTDVAATDLQVPAGFKEKGT